MNLIQLMACKSSRTVEGLAPHSLSMPFSSILSTHIYSVWPWWERMKWVGIDSIVYTVHDGRDGWFFLSKQEQSYIRRSMCSWKLSVLQRMTVFIFSSIYVQCAGGGGCAVVKCLGFVAEPRKCDKLDAVDCISEGNHSSYVIVLQ